MTRAVLDTSTLVSGLVFGGVPARVLARAGQAYELVLSEALLAELDDVLRRPKIAQRARFGTEERQAALGLLRELAQVLAELEPVPAFEPDPKDTHVLACVATAESDYLVTGDAALLELGTYRGTRVVTPREFLDLLPSD